jgi:hypothetical protein
MPSITKESDGTNPSTTTLTVERLKELLHYDPETGVFTWKVRVANVPAGSIAGCNKERYHFIGVDGREYRAHRLAWLYMTGEWPVEIDHRDTDGHNNRWANLRHATRIQNCRNTGLPKNSTSGSKGVYWSKDRQRWVAQITINKVRTGLGRFHTKERAAAASEAAARKHFGEFARVA